MSAGEGRRQDYLGDRERTYVRLPVTLRETLEAEASRQRVPLNTLITTILAGAVGWKPQKQKRRRPAA